jgi:Na+-transporting NADH:ubiquinone oxidoreductase subunit NqrE
MIADKVPFYDVVRFLLLQLFIDSTVSYICSISRIRNSGFVSERITAHYNFRIWQLQNMSATTDQIIHPTVQIQGSCGSKMWRSKPLYTIQDAFYLYICVVKWCLIDILRCISEFIFRELLKIIDVFTRIIMSCAVFGYKAWFLIRKIVFTYETVISMNSRKRKTIDIITWYLFKNV